jgi:predicted DNA binding protein
MSRHSSPRFEHHPEHDHSILVYESRAEQFESVVPFVKEGLAANEQCIYTGHDTTRAEIADTLRERGANVDAALASGQLTIRRAEDVYFDGGGFDPDAMVDRIEQYIAGVDEEYDGLRITGELTWVAEYDVDRRDVERYELAIERLAPNDDFTGLCQYRRSRFDPEFLDSLLQHHPHLVYENEQRLNCYYRPPEEHAGDGCNAATIDRKLKTISEQNHVSTLLDEREQSLSLLGRYTKQLREADPDEVERTAAESISEVLDPAFVAFLRYDTRSTRLRTSVLRNTLSGVDGQAVLGDLSDRTWTAFAENELSAFTVDAGANVQGLVLPVGQHGVFVVGTDGASPISEATLDSITTLAGHAEAVLDRFAYERHIEEQNERLREQNEQRERVDKINAVVRQIGQSIVAATTEEEIATGVCELLVEETCVEFTWFGSYSPGTDSIAPVHTAGDVQGYLDALTHDDDWADDEPSGLAARSNEPEVVDRVYGEPPLDHWQSQALKRDLQSAASFPVCFDDSMYGVLSLYSTTPEKFGDEIVDVFDELSDCVAHAVNSIKRKRALTCDAVTELDVRVTDVDIPLVDSVREYECCIDIDEIAATRDGGVRVFATFHDISPMGVRSLATTAPPIDELEVFSEQGDTLSCECLLNETSIAATLLNHNAVPRSLSVEGQGATLTVHLPRDESVRRFMEMFRTKYPSAEAVARRDRAQSLQRLSDIKSRLESDLTERQLEILTIAYQSGYYERPRERTAQDIADSIGVTAATVGRHLREAERRAFSLLFDAE